jgi:hypothetical protein
MKRIFKSKVTAFALGLVAVTMMSLASASAATATRDHRTKPVVRDHRGESFGGVTVRDSASKRKPVDCLGNLCNVKKVCVGPACF